MRRPFGKMHRLLCQFLVGLPLLGRSDRLRFGFCGRFYWWQGTQQESMRIPCVPSIVTERLTLRGFCPADLDRLAVILGAPIVMRYMPGGKPLQRRRTEGSLCKILKGWERRGYGRWAVIHNADQRLIGWCGLEYLPEIDETAVVCLLDSPYWNRGLATEAVHASLRYAFEELGLGRVVGLAHTENAASRRLMEKNGMAFQKTIRLWEMDLVEYAITGESFRSDEAD